MGEATESIIYIILSLGILIVLALVGRQYVCWYFKINDNIDLLREQNKLLKQMLANQNQSVEKTAQNKEVHEEKSTTEKE